MYGLMRSVFSQWYFLNGFYSTDTVSSFSLARAFTHPMLIQLCSSEESNFSSVVNQKVDHRCESEVHSEVEV